MMFGNDVLIIDAKEKSIMKNLWSSMPPRWGKRHINTFNTLCCKNPISWYASCVKCWGGGGARMMATHFSEVEIMFGKMSGHLSCVHVLVEITKKNNVVVNSFHRASCNMSCLKKIVLGDRASPRVWK